MRSLISLLSGAIFGFGLALSGMMNPARVRGFLDLFGDWDPTLAFVMGGAMLVMAVGWLVQKRMSAPIADDSFNLPGTQIIDRRLLGGAALFGIGWALAGLCPGPAIASLGTALQPALVFVAAMLAGMAVYALVDRKPG
ncbi:DUF6691 family protein [Pseudoblastomonas halimionae]|uniref:YeeE/YedE family protein n=1 Tax=Alteriqipengyuania halimionae TaxID=1926630 RepID=A0A6I4TZK0_9SPHN|nr:DUF6691 family protein [Alteriqipengyuania halimionae]MXP09150.1 YeeE/YedE family protein [Alteriqipengyuania halimionae]